jgi:non-ribosomal peptide synthetase component F
MVLKAAGSGAERAAHRWCREQGLPTWRYWHPQLQAGRGYLWSPPENPASRHQRILRDEGPRLVIVSHKAFTPCPGASADIARRALPVGAPVWLSPARGPGPGPLAAEQDLPAPPPGPPAIPTRLMCWPPC